MNSKLGIAGIAIAAVLVAAAVGLRWQRGLEAGLPPRIEAASKAEAVQRAFAFATDSGGVIIEVLGTGSMAPYIPAAPTGADPLNTVVAIVVTQPRATFADIAAGSLVTYRAEWSPRFSVMHQAARRDSNGWIMTGLANAEYEARWRVTENNFLGIVSRTFVWPQ